MKIKAGPQVIDAIKLAYNAMRSVILEGMHGVGKSELLVQAAKLLKIDCIVRDLSLMEPPDLLGLPREKDGRTIYSPPGFLPTKGNGLLVIEELNRAEKYMMSPCLQLLTARTLNDYELPHGWLPIAAINPAAGGYDVNELDPALLSRFCRIEVAADVPAWLEWAADSGVHECVRRYVRSVSDIFETTNPRSWKYVSDLVYAYERRGENNEITLRATVGGFIGDIHAAAFLKTYKSGGVSVTADDVLRHYKRVRPAIISWKKKKRLDLLESVAHELRVQLQDSDLCVSILHSRVMKKNLSEFITDLPADLGGKVHAAALEIGVLS